MNFKIKYTSVPTDQVRQEAGNLFGVHPQERDWVEEFEKEGRRLGLIFNGMQKRINHQLPVALFTDKKTKSTFAVEPGQSIKSKLIELRKKFRSFKTHLSDRKTHPFTKGLGTIEANKHM